MTGSLDGFVPVPLSFIAWRRAQRLLGPLEEVAEGYDRFEKATLLRRGEVCDLLVVKRTERGDGPRRDRILGVSHLVRPSSSTSAGGGKHDPSNSVMMMVGEYLGTLEADIIRRWPWRRCLLNSYDHRVNITLELEGERGVATLEAAYVRTNQAVRWDLKTVKVVFPAPSDSAHSRLALSGDPHRVLVDTIKRVCGDTPTPLDRLLHILVATQIDKQFQMITFTLTPDGCESLPRSG